MKAYDVVGYVHADGYALCGDCADPHDEHLSPVFADSEGQLWCDACQALVIGDDEGDDMNRAETMAQTDPVGRIILQAVRDIAALSTVADGEEAMVAARDWIGRLRACRKGETLVVCEIESSYQGHAAAQGACSALVDAAVNDGHAGGMFWRVYDFDGNCGQHAATQLPPAPNDLGPRLARDAIATCDQDVYARVPVVELAAPQGNVTVVLDLASLLRSLSDEQLRPHLAWRTADQDLVAVVAGTERHRHQDD